MIQKDQPTIFNGQIVAGLSCSSDGNMKKGDLPSQLQAEVVNNRKRFLQQLSITPDQTVLVRLLYEKTDFTVYKEILSADKGKGITVEGEPFSDGLVTKDSGVALFLPLADCVGAIIFDVVKEVLMVSHLGRHSTEVHGAKKSIEYLKQKFSSLPSDILVWMSPAADGETYPLYKFDHKSLHEINKQHFIDAGVKTENIEISNIDTAKDKNYYSHSAFKRGNQKADGRFAIVAMLK